MGSVSDGREDPADFRARALTMKLPYLYEVAGGGVDQDLHLAAGSGRLVVDHRVRHLTMERKSALNPTRSGRRGLERGPQGYLE
jgi:hypothetical protein